MIEESRPTLERDSNTYRAAVLLLVGEKVKFNVDRLARVTGIDRMFVAKAVRRLYDNGVLVGGAVRADWDGTELNGAFWRDVAVAEGLLYRRESESGELEWGFPGSWWKAFDFGDTSQGASSAVRYSYAVEEEEREAVRPLESSREDEEVDPEPAYVGSWDREPSWSLGSGSRGYSLAGHGSGLSLAGATITARATASAAAPGELFPDAVWLG